VASNGDTVGALFRIHLVSASPDSAHRLEVSRIDTIWRELAHPRRRFPGITVLGDNSLLAARDGPDNASFIDPDARVLQFDKFDTFITPLPAFVTGSGTGIANINHPTSIANSCHFILVQSSMALHMVRSDGHQSTNGFQAAAQFDPAKFRTVIGLHPSNPS
jgi:hypothetical protein